MRKKNTRLHTKWKPNKIAARCIASTCEQVRSPEAPNLEYSAGAPSGGERQPLSFHISLFRTWRSAAPALSTRCTSEGDEDIENTISASSLSSPSTAHEGRRSERPFTWRVTTNRRRWLVCLPTSLSRDRKWLTSGRGASSLHVIYADLASGSGSDVNISLARFTHQSSPLIS